MAQTYFYPKTVDFNNATGDPKDFISMSVSHNFSTKILGGDVVLKGFDVIYEGDNYHNIYACGAKVTNVNFEENTLSCDVQLKFNNCTGNGTNYLDKSKSSAEVTFLATCE
uniref:Uncharacterized protein n=1 Tax=Pseudobryopsis hainanensis TaxID=2320808 RepID=A0A3S7SY57_9CHLO|nr:hypothetical protein [Pseudobryopsis hainanensis]